MTTETTPTPVIWFKVYCGLMTTIYGLLLIAAPFLIFMDFPAPDGEDIVLKIYGGFILVISLFLAIACALPIFLPPKPWVWIYSLVVICLGLTSICFWPICIPLLIYWIKDPTKAHYGRT
ncbi:MAG: hypothetical protein AAF558_03280 [Verrucomicrobiota bacterium]